MHCARTGGSALMHNMALLLIAPVFVLPVLRCSWLLAPVAGGGGCGEVCGVRACALLLLLLRAERRARAASPGGRQQPRQRMLYIPSYLASASLSPKPSRIAQHTTT